LVLFAVVSLSSPPTQPSVPDDRPAPPTPEEIYVLEELAEWVLGHPLSEGFRLYEPSDLAGAVRQRRQSFELFRKYGPASDRRDLVRGLPYGHLIDNAAERFSVDSLLLVSIMEAESGFNPYAISPQGALGLMQVMPDTAGFHTVEDLLEPAVNIEIGARYFGRLLHQFDGDVALALASYNAGPGMVRRYGGLPPFPETRHYVDRVLTRYVRLQRNLWQNSGATELLF
jgi:soluble lytic murein transglycosylase-like protein